MVGDVKQSIYKFRPGETGIISGKIQHIHVGGERAPEDRASPELSKPGSHTGIDQCDFYRIMTEKLGNISYTEDAALHPGAAFEERDGLDELKTELLLVDLSVQPQKETESPS